MAFPLMHLDMKAYLLYYFKINTVIFLKEFKNKNVASF